MDLYAPGALVSRESPRLTGGRTSAGSSSEDRRGHGHAAARGTAPSLRNSLNRPPPGAHAPPGLLAWQQDLGLRPRAPRLLVSTPAGNGARQWAATLAAGARHRARRRLRIVAVADALADAATWTDRVFSMLAPDAGLWSAHFACSLSTGRGELVGLGCRSTRALAADAVIALHPSAWPANSATRMLAAIGAAPRQVYLGPRSAAPEHPWTDLVDDREDTSIRRIVYSGTGDPLRPEDLGRRGYTGPVAWRVMGAGPDGAHDTRSCPGGPRRAPLGRAPHAHPARRPRLGAHPARPEREPATIAAGLARNRRAHARAGLPRPRVGWAT